MLPTIDSSSIPLFLPHFRLLPFLKSKLDYHLVSFGRLRHFSIFGVYVKKLLLDGFPTLHTFLRLYYLMFFQWHPVGLGNQASLTWLKRRVFNLLNLVYFCPVFSGFLVSSDMWIVPESGIFPEILGHLLLMQTLLNFIFKVYILRSDPNKILSNLLSCQLSLIKF